MLKLFSIPAWLSSVTQKKNLILFIFLMNYPFKPCGIFSCVSVNVTHWQHLKSNFTVALSKTLCQSQYDIHQKWRIREGGPSTTWTNRSVAKRLRAHCPSCTRVVSGTLGKTTAQSICQNQHVVAPCRLWHLGMKRRLIVTFWECKQQSIADPWAPYRLWLVVQISREIFVVMRMLQLKEALKEERERERSPALSAECLLVGEEESDPCPFLSRIQHPLHLVSFFTLPHTGSICQ